MLFLLSAALRFHSKPATELALRSTPRLQSKARALAQELRQLEPKDIKKQLNINDALAKQYVQHLGNFEGQQPIPACALYDSKLYRAIEFDTWERVDAEWANQHTRIFSGLYGAIRPFDEIQPLSLPVRLCTKLKTSKGTFLRNYWAEAVQQELYEAVMKLPLPVVINCAAEEDCVDVLQVDALPEGTRICTVEFKNMDSDTAGEAKGEFVRWAFESQCMTVEELLEFKGMPDEDGEADTFRLSPKNSNPDRIVFERATGDSWGKKLKESGMSKNKFMSEVASGKNRYKRTEINKAFVKEQSKSRRKQTAVY